MEQDVVAFSLIIEGTTEKVFVMPLKSIYNQKPLFHEQKKCIFEHHTEVQKLCHGNIFLMTFLELPPLGLC